jgi:clan AA aspartic protease (TIGR02281 family)
MKQLKFMFSFALFLWMASSDLHADIYQWSDPDGVTHASTDLERVPSAYRGKVLVIPIPTTAGRIETVEEYSIPFEKGPSGIMVVQVFLNDVIRTRMVFDTGASLVLISDELARRMDQAASAHAGERIRLKTAGGDVEGRSFLIQKIDLGNAVKENVRAAVSNQKQAFDDFDGLLGLSFLEGFKVTIDQQSQRILLRRQ